MTVHAADLSKPATAQEQSPFRFVSDLARELSAGRVDLPSYPEAASRLQQALADDTVTSERLARVVGSDAGLTARLLTMANSALLNRSGSRVTDLKLAITRVGYSNIRAAALAYAAAQLQRAPELAHIRDDLEKFWQEGIHVAALAHAIAKECRRVRPDEAMLAGLLHNIGKIYIIAHSAKPGSGASHDSLSATLHDWHPGIGKALIENWKLPEEIAAAVGGQLDLERHHDGSPDLQDVLIVAVHIAEQMASGNADDSTVSRIRSAQTLGLSDSALVRIMLESHTEVEMLQAALG